VIPAVRGLRPNRTDPNTNHKPWSHVPVSASLNPCSGAMNAPQRLSPEQLPDPWLLDTEGLLSELVRIRELALRIPPVRNDIIGPINSVIDGVWDLEQRLRYCLHLHCEAQRAFARQHDKKLAKRQNVSCSITVLQSSPACRLSLSNQTSKPAARRKVTSAPAGT
jgi:hypothetical protein